MATTPPQPKTPSLDLRDYAMVALMNLVWGLNIVAVKMGLGATTPFTAAAVRQAIVLMVCAGSLRIVRGRMGPLLLLGLLNGALFLVLINMALIFSHNVSALAIATQLGVPFSLILGVLFLGERIGLPRIAGVLLAFAGVALVGFDRSAIHEAPGLILTAGSSLVWAIGNLIQRRLAGVPVLTIYAWIGLIGFAVLSVAALLLEPQSVRSLPAMRVGDLGWIAFSAIGSTVIGQGGMAWLLQRHPLSSVAPLTLASPIVAVLASSWFFAIPLTPLMLGGGAIAIAGVAIITVRGARRQEGL